jgi:hypothetical protein
MPQPTSKARLVITALFVDHQSPGEVAARYGVHRAWVYKLKARYEAEGEAAFEPLSRRPKTSPTAIVPDVGRPHPAGPKRTLRRRPGRRPETIAWHLQHHHGHRMSRSTISRHLTAAGLVTPERAEEVTEVLLHPLRGIDAQRDLAVRLHPLPAHPSRRPTRRRRRDHQLARRLHPLRPPRLRAPQDHHPDREGHLPRNRRSTRHPCIHPDRQRHGLHRPPGWHRTPRRTQRLRAAAPRLERGPEALPTQPPHHQPAWPNGSSRR